MEIVAVDLGGTHVRFARVSLDGGRIAGVDRATTLKIRDFSTFAAAWRAYVDGLDGAKPRAAAIAIACPVNSDPLKLTNNPWVLRPGRLAADLDLDRLTLVNDFGAVAHALAHVDGAALAHVTGPDVPLPDNGVISVVGPGTGLGVAQVLRRHGRAHVIETEGGHSDFAPFDEIDDAVLTHLRARHRRVSVERVVSGPGLASYYKVLSAMEGRPGGVPDDRALWQAAIEGADPLAVAALDRFFMSLGSVAGDIVLTHGASALVIAGGLGARLANLLPDSAFAYRFRSKGRFETFMTSIPVRVLTDPQMGLLGAAAAFIKEHGGGG